MLFEIVSGPRIYLLLETAHGSGIGDHTTLMIHKYAEHAELMARVPVIDVDYCVAKSDHGFGLKALRDFDVGDVTGNCLLLLAAACCCSLFAAACCCSLFAAACCLLLLAAACWVCCLLLAACLLLLAAACCLLLLAAAC